MIIKNFINEFMLEIKNKFGEDVLVDESLLKAKDIVYKTLKKCKFSEINHKDFFDFCSDGINNKSEAYGVYFSIEPWDIPGIFVELLNQKLKKTDYCIDFVDEGDRVNFIIVKKEMSGHIF